jgi:hypothetical protein
MATDAVKDPRKQQEEGNEGQKPGQDRTDRGKQHKKRDNKNRSQKS